MSLSAYAVSSSRFKHASVSLKDCLYPSAASSPGSMLSRCHRAESGQRQPREALQKPTEGTKPLRVSEGGRWVVGVVLGETLQCVCVYAHR